MTNTVVEQKRICGPCERCCIELRVDVLGKDPGVPCEHLHGPLGSGCTRYADRPPICRAYQCLWLLCPDLLGEEHRPDVAGVIFTPKLASEIQLPARQERDWLVIVAQPCYGLALADRPEPMEAVRRLRAAGLSVLLDERRATGRLPALENALRPPSDAFVRSLAGALGLINHTDAHTNNDTNTNPEEK
jgi:hypothetical protein